MSTITEFYKRRTLLVTGGTGFMGKVLLEKLIRSLPEIERIYVLLRPRKGLSPSERLLAITSKPPFTLNNLDEDHFKKMVAMQGDTSREDLGLSSEDRTTLIEETSVVFHLAASVRMNISLKEAVLQNTVSTERILNLCEKMKNLVSVVHLSTAYCNPDIDSMEEKLYRMNLDPYNVIELVQCLDEETLSLIQERLINPHPNTYTFSKRLAEIAVFNKGKKLPVVICRPSIVTPSLREPAPGWIDNFNGAVGLLTAAGKGIIRSVMVDRECVPQISPVDVTINSSIVCGWYRTTADFTETPIYNITQGDTMTKNWGGISDKFRDLVAEYPYERFLWCTVCKETTNIWYHYVIVLLFHMIPAYLIDFLLVSFLQKPFLVQIQNRLNTGMEVIRYFAVRPWKFTNEKLMKIKEMLSPEDNGTFYLIEVIDMDQYLRDCFFGSRKFCLNEGSGNVTFLRIVIKILYFLEYSGRALLLYWTTWCVLYLFSATRLLTWQYWI